MKTFVGAFMALVLVLFSTNAKADFVDPQLDRAATEYEGLTEHFHETVHFGAPQSHLDEDAHELAEAALQFYEEVHHGHDTHFLQNEWQSVRNIYNHTSHTYWEAYFRWSAHIREDWRLVTRGHRNVEHALYWGGHHDPHPHH